MVTSHQQVLYIHDHKFKKHNNGYFSEGKFTNDVLSRYITSNDKLTVLSRMEMVSKSNNLSQITLDNIKFTPIKGLVFSKIISIHMLDNFRLIMDQLEDSDFIVVRLPSFLGIITLSINIITKKPYFIEVVGDAELALLTARKHPSFFYKKFTLLFSHANKFFIRNAKGAIYVTENSLQKKYPTKGMSAYASNVEVIVKSRELNFNDFQCRNKYFKVGLIGSFNNHYKGIKEAIEAIHTLRQKNYDVHLHILGSGSLQNEYEELSIKLQIQECIHFDGILSGGEHVIKWIESLDLYIQPSYTEGLPRALIEAMTVGIPAIATEVGGIPELLENDYLIEPYNSELLASKMENFINSQQLRYVAGKSNYNKSKNYDKNLLKKRRDKFWRTARQLILKSS